MRDLKTLKACDVMVRPVVSARLNASSRDVALQFLSGLYSGMPITDDEGKVVGVVTELDLLNAVVEGRELVKLTAEELMSKDPVTADVETPVTDIVKLMKEKN
ncbi:MAG: CBS domain-containing protein, partial [Desulfosarcina sp.]|nr:CBS domain-containing protein [Desulfosarcina sp.]MBC2767812.1 CBS domain-containing protein [Desulfosarcina sp.]